MGWANAHPKPDFRLDPTIIADMRHKANIGYCNITTCCTRVCPEHIHVTDNAIIRLKERVVDCFYDPVTRLLRMVTGSRRLQPVVVGRRSVPPAEWRHRRPRFARRPRCWKAQGW